MPINIIVCPIFHLSITWTQSKDKNSLYATAPRWEDKNFTYSDLDLCKLQIQPKHKIFHWMCPWITERME